MSYADKFETEIKSLNHLLNSVPFTNEEPSQFFLNLYQLDYQQVSILNKPADQGGIAEKFPIAPEKLMKFGISLGNLIKTLNVDEQTFLQQKTQPRLAQADPFNDKLVDGDTKQENNDLQPYQLKFVTNLLNLLKNFDIGSYNELNSTNSSPIKLSSKQLFIEKLEINIDLDNLFVFKIVLKLLIKVYTILQQQQLNFNIKEVSVDSSSIFSTNSSGSSFTSQITPEQYFKYINQIIPKVKVGLTEPFLNLIVHHVVNENITSSFNNLLSNI